MENNKTKVISLKQYNIKTETININTNNENYISIKSKMEFEKNIDKTDKMILIRINKTIFNDLSILTNHNLINLKQLILINNNIIDIEPLLKVNFSNLELLNLEYNKIGDEMIETINKLDFPKLNNLNFKRNNFTSYQVFSAVSKSFPIVKYLNMSSNIFKEDISFYKTNKTSFYFNSLTEIYLSNGVFNINSIYLISQFKLDNLEILELKGNNLNSLSFLDSFDGNNLKELYIYEGNSIKADHHDKLKLKKFKKLIKTDIIYQEDMENISAIENEINDDGNSESINSYLDLI